MGHRSPITAYEIDRARSCYYTADRLGVLSVWKDNEASWFTGAGHGKGIVGLSVNHDGSKVCTVGLDDKLRENDAKSQEFNTDASPLGGTPTTVKCGNKSDVIVVGLAQSKIVVKLGGDMKTISTSSKPLCFAFSPDDSTLAVGFEKGVIVYKVSGSDLSVSLELKDHLRPVNTVEYSPCGKYLITSGQDKRILVYDGSKILNPSEWEFHNGMVTAHAFSPDGKKVASVGSDLTIFIWTDTDAWKTGRKTKKMAHREGITGVGWIDDETLLTVGADSCMKVWKV